MFPAATARVRPSGLYDTPYAPPRRPGNVPNAVPVAALQTRTL